MGKYGIIALEAVKLLQKNKSTDYLTAWYESAETVFEVESSSYKKGCPRNSFVGLCESGLIKEVEGLNSLQNVIGQLNKSYAIKAIHLLKQERSLAENRSNTMVRWMLFWLCGRLE
jgi:hypothetical protein